jgi:hypothetical protein
MRIAATAVVVVLLAACGGSGGPSAKGCIADIVAHLCANSVKFLPHCNGLSHSQVIQASEAALAQGAFCSEN